MYAIHQHLRYNYWANSRIVETLQAVPEELIFKEIQSSFSSVAKTLLHMWDAENIWILRMKGETLKASPSAEFKGGKDNLFKGFMRSSESLNEFIEGKDASFLSKSYDYRNLKGEPFTSTIEETLFHIVNHGTYHRGQVITMLRGLGITTLLSTDLIHYLRSVRK